MICRKCESRINSGTKCYQCGYENDDNKRILTQNSANSKKNKRSPALIVIILLFIVLGILTVVSSVGLIIGDMVLANLTALLSFLSGISNSLFFVYIPYIPFTILAGITIIVAILDIVLCMFILGLKKRAFQAYGVLIIIGGIMKIINNISIVFYAPVFIFGQIFPFVLKGLLLFVIYKTDGNLFGFGKSESK